MNRNPSDEGHDMQNTQRRHRRIKLALICKAPSRSGVYLKWSEILHSATRVWPLTPDVAAEVFQAWDLHDWICTFDQNHPDNSVVRELLL